MNFRLFIHTVLRMPQKYCVGFDFGKGCFFLCLLGVDGLENLLNYVCSICLIGVAKGCSGISWMCVLVVGLGIDEMGFEVGPYLVGGYFFIPCFKRVRRRFLRW